MAYSNLITKDINVASGNDGVIFPKVVADIPGGRSLDVTDWTLDTIPAGVVVIKTSAGEYAPLTLASGETAYDSIPDGATVVGFNKTTIEKNDAQAAIVVEGTVNEPALPFAVTSTIKSALNGIVFINA